MKFKEIKFRNYLPTRGQIITGIVVAGLFAVANVSEKNSLRRERDGFKERAGLLEEKLSETKKRVALAARNMAISARAYSVMRDNFVGGCEENETPAYSGLHTTCEDAPAIMIVTTACVPSAKTSVEEIMHTHARLLAEISGDTKIIAFVEGTKPGTPREKLPELCIAPEEPEIAIRPRIDVRILPFILVPESTEEAPEDREPEAQRQPEGRTL